VSYATRSAHETYYLLAFAVDGEGEVHGLYPSYEDAATDPVAVALPPGRALTPMATETALDDVPAGRVRVYGVLGPRPLHVSDVERLPPSALETPERIAASLHGADVRAWELRIEARRAEAGAP
jgi:hypothetical protein